MDLSRYDTFKHDHSKIIWRRRRIEKIWLKFYPEGMPAEIDASIFSSVTELLEDSFRINRDKPAFTCMGKVITYGELDTLSKRLSVWFQSRGLKPGARIAIMMPNLLQYPVTVIAVLQAGYTVVNGNPLYTPRELEHQLKDSGAEAIVVLENFAKTVEAVVLQTAIKHVVIATMGDLMGLKGLVVNFVVRHVKKMVPKWGLPLHIRFNEALREGGRGTFMPVEVRSNDIAFLQYTGGTTGVAKCAVLLHRNVIANVLQSEVWLEPARKNRPNIDQVTTVVALPLYHIFALTVCGLLAMRTAVWRADPESARHCRHDQGAQGHADQHVSGREYVVQRYAQSSGLHQARFLEDDRSERGRDGGAGSRRKTLVRYHGFTDYRRIWAVRDVSLRDLQSDYGDRVHRHDRLAVSIDGNLHSRRRE